MSGLNSLYILSSRMLNQRQELEVIANNVANANTSGFKKMEMDYRAQLARKDGAEVGNFSMKRPLAIDYAVGGITRTGAPLDIALLGEGFFAVEVAPNQVEYTRNGSFQLDVEGNLITQEGYPVLDANNAAINIPVDGGQIRITQDGTIANENGVVNALGVFSFAQPERLVNTGGSRFKAAEAPVPVFTPKIMQGALEDSNVNSIQETVKMTELVRAYQSATRLIRSLEDVESQAIRDISRMPS